MLILFQFCQYFEILTSGEYDVSSESGNSWESGDSGDYGESDISTESSNSGILILMNLVIFLKLMTLVVLVQSVTNMFEYFDIRIFLIQIFIRIFVRIIFWIGIYSDIRLCQLFGYKYIRIFVRSKILNGYIQIFVQF